MNFRAENNEWHHGFQMDFANGCTISVQFSKVEEHSDVMGYCTADSVSFIMELARNLK